jgi:hypothetical protein
VLSENSFENHFRPSVGSRRIVYQDSPRQISGQACLHIPILVKIEKNNKTPCLKTYIKSSRHRPGVAQRFPGGLGSQIFMTFGT